MEQENVHKTGQNKGKKKEEKEKENEKGSGREPPPLEGSWKEEKLLNHGSPLTSEEINQDRRISQN